jgi:inner membrane protein
MSLGHRHPDTLLNWLARLAARRTVSLALVAAIVITDRTIEWHGFSFVLRAMVDEPCHLATALVVLGAITRVRGAPPNPRFGWTMLLCSVLIDVDHLPQEFGSSILTAGTPRPYTHALWVVLVLIMGMYVARYWSRRAPTPTSTTAVQILLGAAWGVSAHFLRDVATAPMSLWWPITNAPVEVPYLWYVLALVLIVAIPVVRPRHKSAGPQKAERTLAFHKDQGPS